jgi:hypothetical protein
LIFHSSGKTKEIWLGKANSRWEAVILYMDVTYHQFILYSKYKPGYEASFSPFFIWYLHKAANKKVGQYNNYQWVSFSYQLTDNWKRPTYITIKKRAEHF